MIRKIKYNFMYLVCMIFGHKPDDPIWTLGGKWHCERVFCTRCGKQITYILSDLDN
jgi:hypothetical protein